MALRFGSLFAGIGGFDKGLVEAGLCPKWAVEIDPGCQRVLRHHWPDVLLLGDVRECGANNLPPVDVITFGSPCQDLSLAGRRAGLAGARSSLFYESIRIVSELRPALAVWENVPGSLSSNAGRDFAAILCAFQECGASDICWRVLDAQYFGVAQTRRRVFLVADFRGESAAQILLESPCGCGHPVPCCTKKQGAASGVAPGDSGDGGEPFVAGVTLRTRGENGKQIEWQEKLAYSLNNPGAGGRADGAMVAAPHRDGLTVRRLTPLEGCRLQGFPDDWLDLEPSLSDSQKYRMIGNAVCTRVSAWLGRRIMLALGGTNFGKSPN